MPKFISKLFISIIGLSAISFAGWWFYSGKISFIDTHEVSKSFGQFIALKGTDEYVVAQLVSNEEFITEQYKYLLGYPVGDTSAKLSLVANYKYYVKLAELTHQIENDIIVIRVPKLYLSSPVAFDFSSVQENGRKFLFGDDVKNLLDRLKSDVSGELTRKGRSQVGVVYDKAAKALADNFNNYFNANGYGNHYKSIVVIFSSEGGRSHRQFRYGNSLCGTESCSLELDLGKGRVFTIR